MTNPLKSAGIKLERKKVGGKRIISMCNHATPCPGMRPWGSCSNSASEWGRMSHEISFNVMKMKKGEWKNK